MGLFGGSKSSSKKYIRETNVNNVDNRVTEADVANIGGNVSISAGDNLSAVSVTTTDFGAIDKAGELAQSAFESSAGSVATAVGALKATAGDAVKVAESAARDESARTMQFLILGVALVGIAFVIRKRF